ncbi:cyclic nucleotide-gated cation channel beta-1-like [Gossypium australe]|uniref:Cyclic nucleotide-gated cation channel beta-1-like n=1 Tax=Gossypium australe TaxID=47621 RepID=A0A5B6VBJ9_9ROSI|nr:cyclic nucleotide-gated cation channel beta-1-like [Gossypium australe]
MFLVGFRNPSKICLRARRPLMRCVVMVKEKCQVGTEVVWLSRLNQVMPRAQFRHRIRYTDPDQSTADDATSNALAPAQGTVPVHSGPETRGQREEAREAFLQMMSNWYTEYVRANPNAQPPPPSPIPQPVPVAPQGIDLVRITKPTVDKIRKHGAKEFRANIDDHPERAEFEDGLNEDVRLLVRILELKEFVVLVDRASKAEELSKEKRKAVSEARDVRKKPMSKSYQAQSKRSKEVNPRTTTLVGYSQKERGNTYSGSRVQATSMESVGNPKSKPECPSCGRHHTGEC